MNTKLRSIKISCLYFVLVFSPIAVAEPVKVTFLAPEPQDNLFWGPVANFMTAVADDLGIDLEVIFSPASGSYILKRLGLKVLNREEKPDYILIGYFIDVTEAMMIANIENDTRIFVFNTSLNRRERRIIGYPRGNFPNWIGHIYPDDKQAGFDLAETLIAKLNRSVPGEQPKIAGLAGGQEAPVSINRVTGLKQSAIRHKKSNISKVYNTTWDKQSAVSTTKSLLRELPDTNIIWTVADALALGSVETVKSTGRAPGKDVFIGGFDWSAEAFDSIKRGEMTASIGGHFMEGGWALIMIYDYHNGIDFQDDPGITSTTNMQVITNDNITEFEKKLGDRDWSKINFKPFTKTHNPELKKYDFSLDALLSNLD